MTTEQAPIDQATLQNRLEELSAKYDVPGASVAVLSGDQVVTAAVGVVNRETGVAATPQTLFQIGSITKVYTAALVARFVERGELDLDEPVRTYLPEFQVADDTATETVTLRHLLSHSSGIDGDHFEDTGRGDDVLEKYVASCSKLEQQFPVGATMSYCNAGFGMIGRVLEKVSGKVWDQVLREELLTPLGLEHTVTLPEEALRFNTACGHVGEPGSLKLTPQWGIPRSSGPAGLINATAEDVVRYAQVFLRGGETVGGERWLKESTVASMLEPQVEVPNPYTLGSHWAVGWILYRNDDRVVYGHDGSTLGQGAFLRMVPDRGVAVSLLTNGGGIGDLGDALLRDVLRQTADVELPARVEPVDGASGGDRSTQIGTYVRAASTMKFEEKGESGLTLTVINTSELAEVMDDEDIVVELLPVAEETYVGQLPGAEGWTPVVFFDLDNGRYVHLGARATERTGD
jgi:CubicO group peptidase (beta-lactamase class C family)